MEWTEPGRVELERFLEAMRLELSEAEASDVGDPDEVVEDMRRHVHEELAIRGVTMVTLEALAPILGALGAGGDRPRSDTLETPKEKPNRKRSGDSSVFMGVACFLSISLAFVTLFVEASNHMCAEMFFDPLPTPWHMFLVFCVPASQAIIALTDQVQGPMKRLGYGVLSGLGIGISAYYSLIFLPLLPFALVALVAGIGLLPMSPLISLVTSIYLYRKLRRENASNAPGKIPGVWFGIAFGLLALPAASLPGIVTDYGLRMALSEDPEESARGVEFLRDFGSEERLLENCYVRPSSTNDPISMLLQVADPVVPRAARPIYYRVTGFAFNSVAPPDEWRDNWLVNPEFGWRGLEEQGGTEVAGRSAELSLASSRIDTKVQAAEATAYTEWTLVFRNDSRELREARGQIVLPPGSLVSRLTLWVDGEPLEAAFASVGETRGAYQAVVRRRRDPVLVTTSGPDRVLMQCFPVPQNGGEMKVRVGFTSPLALDAAGQGTLALPSFTERNFDVRQELRHSVWIESTHELAAGVDALTYEKPAGDEFTARGELDDEALTDPAASIQVKRPADANLVWSEQSFGDGESVVLQTLSNSSIGSLERVIFAIDGSATMSAVGEQIARSLSAIPGAEFGVIIAGDTPVELVAPTLATPEALEEAAELITEFDYLGGRDLVPAATLAWDRCAEKEGSILMLVHGAQPVELSSVEALTQRMDRRSNGPRIVAVRATRGPNRVLRGLEGKRELTIFPRQGPLEEDLRSAFDEWKQGRVTMIRRREVSSDELENLGGAKEASRHVSRLWAADSILEARREQMSDWRDSATQLAAHYQIVTPVSGAVVLESAAQMAAAGLEQGDPQQVPSVPEPEMVLLILITLVMLAFSWRRREVLA